MDLKINSVTPSFSARFIDNKSMRNVINYAEETKQMHLLDSALNALSHVNEGDILLIDGKLPDGRVFSNFTLNKHGNYSVQNVGAETPEKASFDAILDLSELGPKFKKLFRAEVKWKMDKSEVIKKYLTPNG